MTPRSFQFASFTFDLDRLGLFGPCGQADLRPKSFEVLRHLVDHAGRVVGKDELIAAVWPDVTATDESLTRCISDIRRALGGGGHRIIKTVPRRGYLLDATISVGEATAGAVARPMASALGPRPAATPYRTLDVCSPAPARAYSILQFDRFALDLTRGCLRADGHEITLRPKAFDLLRHLAENAGRLVPKQEIHQVIWPDVVVSDDSIMQCVRELRKTLGDEQHRLIKMVPRRGYMLDAELTTATLESDPSARQQTGIWRPERPSIAVLPLVNLNDDQDHRHFARGTEADVVTALSRCTWLSVIAGPLSRTNASDGRNGGCIGRRPRADYLLGGTVRYVGSRLRITVQLVDALSRGQIWAEGFDGDASDIFALQVRIAESVVAAIEPSLERAELKRLRHRSVGGLYAYELVLRAQALANQVNEEGMAGAISYLQQAIAIDPSHPLAMALAAHCYTLWIEQGWSSSPEEDRHEGLRLAIRALEIDQQDPRVLSLGSVAIRSLGKDSARGWELAARSLELNPNSTGVLTRAAWAEVYIGNPVKGLELLRRAERLNPRHPQLWFTAAAESRACFAIGQYEGAVRGSRKSLAQVPRYSSSLRTLTASLAKLGRMDEAAQALRRLLSEEPRLSVGEMRWRQRHMPESLFTPLIEGLSLAGLPK